MLQRREVLRAGLVGFSGLTLPGLLRARAAVEAEGPRTAIILVWLRGGGSHLDTWDPKPAASTAYRGPFAPISTTVPGTQVSELLPKLASIAGKYSILRSVAHDAGGHPAGSLRVLSGDPARGDKLKPNNEGELKPHWAGTTNENFTLCDGLEVPFFASRTVPRVREK